ncbi:hypothetical protein PN36_28235 [Candidatus Thiomargarita nelsonii]|uniref:Uncharacterized protein n=1 Tax=Candidatus Thiomargarita nelsonii TaxID=1003181 RepID=A0A0A6P5R1_9GAMM|nr:hypothetical protein PN36_28235 [Candidatus Thiomargarita nelsonii]
MVAIASDGATHCVQQGRMLPLFDVASQLLAFQDLSDDFVKRHTESVLAQRGIEPADDLSIGVFVQ